MEAYKHEFHKLPHEGIHAEFKLDEIFPGLPGMGKKGGAKHWIDARTMSDERLLFCISPLFSLLFKYII